jgi:membrane-associated phospholipid phosphatase
MMASPSREFTRLCVASLHEMATAPSRWRGGQWAAFVTFLLAVAVALVGKRPVEAAFFHAPGSAAAVARFLDVAGSGWTLTGACLLLLALGLSLRSTTVVDTVTVLAVVGLFCFAATQLGQMTFNEHRPIEGGELRLFGGRGHGVSGHAIAAAMVASPLRFVLAKDARRRTRRVVTVLVFVWMVLVGWSRMWLGMHYLWNVMLGLAVGLFVGRSVVTAWQSAPWHVSC